MGGSSLLRLVLRGKPEGKPAFRGRGALKHTHTHIQILQSLQDPKTKKGPGELVFCFCFRIGEIARRYV